MRVRPASTSWWPRREARPGGDRSTGPLAEDALAEQVRGALGPVAERLAGRPTWLVAPELRRAWSDRFGGDLGEPMLGWVAQAVQDRQAWPIRWRGAPGPGPLEHWRRAELELPADPSAAAGAGPLVRGLLVLWGVGAEQLAEDAALLVPAVLAAALDRADASRWPRLGLTLRTAPAPACLRVCLTVRHPRSGPPTVPGRAARARDRDAVSLLDALAPGWSRHADPGGDRLWFETGGRAAPAAGTGAAAGSPGPG